MDIQNSCTFGPQYGPQVKHDNVHMKKKNVTITEHASLPLLPNLHLSYSLLRPLSMKSVPFITADNIL